MGAFIGEFMVYIILSDTNNVKIFMYNLFKLKVPQVFRWNKIVDINSKSPKFACTNYWPLEFKIFWCYFFPETSLLAQ